MISRIIEVCERNRFLVFTGAVLLTLTGIWAMGHIPLDALPDISDVQVIIHTGWSGEPPSVIEDQVTYPIVSTLLAAPRVKAVRAQTMLGDSYVFVVFQDGTDLYWARSRVIEYLQQMRGRLPAAVSPMIGPDATGAGWVFEYALVDRSHNHSLADLRSIQEWQLRYQLATVPGVAEIASIGGFVKQYQVSVDPNKLLAYGIPLSTVIERVKASTNEVGGRVLELNGARYMVRGLGYLRSLADLENVPVMSKNGTAVLIKDLGTVSFGPDTREGVAEWNGEGETVGGIVVMRDGMNALQVIDGIKRKLAQIKPSLPAGVEVVPAYDRSGLIHDSIRTLQFNLIEEAVIVSLVCIFFLFHFRSALIPILTIPLAVLMAFIPMYYLHVTSNIMSLGGLALAIGVLVDAAIVMVENGYRHLSEHPLNASGVPERERRRILIDAAKQVGPALFFSLLIIVVSFLPVFLLEAQEGRMFRPLAWTKTLAVGFSSDESTVVRIVATARDEKNDLGDALERARCNVDVHCALEAITRVGGESERATRIANAARVEVRDLEEEVGGRLRDLTLASTHHAGDGLRTLGDRHRLPMGVEAFAQARSEADSRDPDVAGHPAQAPVHALVASAKPTFAARCRTSPPRARGTWAGRCSCRATAWRGHRWRRRER